MNNQQIYKIAKKQSQKNVKEYNKNNKTKYTIRFQGKFAYLDRGSTHIGRLQYDTEIKEWDFAVFKYSSETYDPNEFMFPGYELLDGSIEGAMKAGMEIYPDKVTLNFFPKVLGCLLGFIIIPIVLITSLFNMISFLFKKR